MVLHDLAMAARYADHLVAVREDRIAAQGTPRQVVTTETAQEVFGVRCRIRWEEPTGDLSVVPLGRHRSTSARGGAPEAGVRAVTATTAGGCQ